MAEKDILQNLITRLGQSQDDRLPRELGRHFVDVDERDETAQLAQAAKLAAILRCYADSPDSPSGTWAKFFEPAKIDEYLRRNDRTTPPHLGLFVAFLRLCRQPQAALNEITGQHLDFQFQKVLGFERRPAQPDRVHLLLELKKGAPAVEVTAKQAFVAGKDGAGVEVLYRPVRSVVLNHGQVESLMSVHRDNGRLRFAPVADSADGLGGAFHQTLPSWHPFGGADAPPAPVGFALASPVLRLQEGKRTIHVDLHLPGLDPTRHASVFDRVFEAHLTGSKGWLLRSSVSAVVTAGVVTLSIDVPANEPAVVDYAPAVHGHRFAAAAPVVQFLFKPDAPRTFADFEGFTARRAKVRVSVLELRSLALENDQGSLNSKNAFQPFGPQPVVGSSFRVGSDEALSKRLTSLKLHLEWLGAPADLATHYAGYPGSAAMANGVSATLVYHDRTGLQTPKDLALMARAVAATSVLSLDSPPPEPDTFEFDRSVYALLSSGGLAGKLVGARIQKARPIFATPVPAPPDARQGFVTVVLRDDFLHAAYRKAIIANAVSQSTTQLNEPYTPVVRSIRLDYDAESDLVDLGLDDETAFGNLDVQFFHVDCFGQAREHGFLRGRYAFVEDKRVPLLPAHPDEGEFLIGVRGVAAGEYLSLLVQVVEDSADPDEPPQELRWSVLADNFWRPLAASERTLDTSNGLRTSGVVAVTLPAEASTEHTRMPPGLAWLRAAVPAHRRAVCRLTRVASNAVEARFVDQGNDAGRFATALPAGTISKMKAKLPTVKTVTQPFSSFAGRLRETPEMVTRRAAERLRHRDRCVSPWDFERVLLEAFPQVRKVKCIPHATDTSWFAPGHVLVIVVPDLRGRSAVDPLSPRVDLDTLAQMTKFAQARAGMGASVLVRNPRFQRVRLDFRVRLRPGESFLSRRGELQKALVQALSPWAHDASEPIEFGGQVHRSVLLHFVEQLPYVDFVTDFKLALSTADGVFGADLPTVSAETPDAILASVSEHGIREYTSV